MGRILEYMPGSNSLFSCIDIFILLILLTLILFFDNILIINFVFVSQVGVFSIPDRLDSAQILVPSFNAMMSQTCKIFGVEFIRLNNYIDFQDYKCFRGGDCLHLSAYGLRGICKAIYDFVAKEHLYIPYKFPEWEINRFIGKYN